MADPIIQGYLNDQSIDMAKRQGVLKALKAGQAESQLSSMIAQKYGTKYGQSASISGTSTPQTQSPAQPPKEREINPATGQPMATFGEMASGLKDLGVGALKGIGSTITGISELGEKALDATAGAAVRGLGGQTLNMEPTYNQVREKLQPTNQAEQVGFTGEQIGEFLLPAGAAGKAVKAVETATKAASKAGRLSKIAKGAIDLGTKVGLEGITGGGVAAAQKGKIDEDVGVTAAIGAGIPLVGPTIKGLGKVAGEAAGYFASALSGTPKAAIEYAFKNPKVVQTAIARAAQEGGELTAQKILQQAKSAMTTLKTVRRKAYQEGLEALEKDLIQTKKGNVFVKGKDGLFAPTKLSTKGLKDTATKTLKDFGVTTKGRVLDFAEAAIDKTHAKKLQEVVDRVYGWKTNTPTGLNKLRQVINSYKLGGINLGSSEKQYNAIISGLGRNLSEYVGARVPQIAELNRLYATQSDVINNVLKQLKLNTGDPNTALRKLLNVFNPKSQVYRPIVEELGEKAGKDLMSDIAGLTLSQWTPEGIGKYFSGLFTGGAGAAAMSNPVALPAFLAAGAASSPRVVGKIATTAGKLSKSNLKIPAGIKAVGKAAIKQNVSTQ